jgi:hypothetical protein
MIVGADGSTGATPTGTIYVAWWHNLGSSQYDSTASTTDQYTVWAIPNGPTWYNETDPSTDDTAGASLQGVIAGCVLTSLRWDNDSATLANVEAYEANPCGNGGSAAGSGSRCGPPPTTPPLNYSDSSDDNCWTAQLVGADTWDGSTPTGSAYVAWSETLSPGDYQPTAATTDQYTVWAIPDGTEWYAEVNPDADDTTGASTLGTIDGCALAPLPTDNQGETLEVVLGYEAETCN